VTGRPSLFVNPGFTSHILDMSRIESDALLGLLYAHSTRPELLVRHRWNEGDVVIWDNRSTMHYAIDDYSGSERRMRRVTLAGSRPSGPNGIESELVTDPFTAVR
jgi:taurine dioxygenase